MYRFNCTKFNKGNIEDIYDGVNKSILQMEDF